MKKIHFILLIIATITISCTNKPEANFTWSPINPKVGETVQFQNYSENARRYSWNLGDMNISSEENPAHVYKNSGNFIIDLRVHKGLQSDEMTVTINIGN